MILWRKFYTQILQNMNILTFFFFKLCVKVVTSVDCMDGSWVKGSIRELPYNTTGMKSDHRGSDSIKKWQLKACPAEQFAHNCFYRGDVEKALSLYTRQYVFVSPQCHSFLPTRFLSSMTNKNIIFIGDSIMMQIWQMLVCTLHDKTKTELDIAWGTVSNYAPSLCPLGPKHCHLQIHENASAVAFFPHYNFTFTIHWLAGTEYKFGKLASILRLHKINYNNSFVILSFGVWHNYVKDFIKAVEELGRELNINPPLRQVLTILESTPQHYGGENGYYNFQKQDGPQKSCFSTNIYNETLDWRNHFLNKIADSYSIPVIRISKGLQSQWDAHLSRDSVSKKFLSEFLDCSHWCAPSGVFRYIFDMMYNSLLKNFQLEEAISSEGGGGGGGIKPKLNSFSKWLWMH